MSKGKLATATSVVLKSMTPFERVMMVVFLGVLALTFAGEALAPHPTESANPAMRLVPPNSSHLLGTDGNGMDVFSRVLAAPQVDVVIAVAATLLSVLIGSPLGVLIGLFESSEGRFASRLSEGSLRLLDVIQAFPVFILAMVLVAIRGPTRGNIIAAIAFVNIPVFIRLVRSEVLSLRERPFAEAARAVGNSPRRVAFVHLLPNATPRIIVQVSVTIGFAVLLTAGLSFVGAGISPPTPELGAMVASNARFLFTGQWWPALFPGAALGIIVFAFAITGETIGRLSEPGVVRRTAKPDRRELSDENRRSEASSVEAGVEWVQGSVSANSLGEETSAGNRVATARLKSNEKEAPILRVTGLSVGFHSGSAASSSAIRDISLTLVPGEVIGVVGASGAGKSVLVRALLQLLPHDSTVAGSIEFDGTDLRSAHLNVLRELRGKHVGAILPDAKSQLNPVIRVGDFMQAALRSHGHVSRGDARRRCIAMLEQVGISDPARRYAQYPHELSGGMAQRVCIALALLHDPKLIVADEPTAGLDVTVQRQILDLMAELVRERGAAQLLVTRDFGIAAHYCQKVAVMHMGRVVEYDTPARIFSHSESEPAQRLVEAAIPDVTTERSAARKRSSS